MVKLSFVTLIEIVVLGNMRDLHCPKLWLRAVVVIATSAGI
jgi:hypothetical protein